MYSPTEKEMLSKLIVKLRAGRSHRKFARILGVSYAAIRSWEYHESMPNISSLQKLANYTNQTIEELLDYLKGDNNREIKKNLKPEIKVAEDAMSLIQHLSKKERARLTKLLINQIIDEE